MTMTYGALRTPRQVEVDEAVMEYVKRGMALLEREYGPDFVDHIDLLNLDLADANLCVLGQLYDNATPSREQWEKANRAGYRQGQDGYSKGIVIIDSELLEEGPEAFGFETDHRTDYEDLTEGWRYAIEEARRERGDGR